MKIFVGICSKSSKEQFQQVSEFFKNVSQKPPTFTATCEKSCIFWKMPKIAFLPLHFLGYVRKCFTLELFTIAKWTSDHSTSSHKISRSFEFFLENPPCLKKWENGQIWSFSRGDFFTKNFYSEEKNFSKNADWPKESFDKVLTKNFQYKFWGVKKTKILHKSLGFEITMFKWLVFGFINRYK